MSELLEAIRARDAESGPTWFTGPASFTAQAARDRRTLLGMLVDPGQAQFNAFQVSDEPLHIIIANECNPGVPTLTAKRFRRVVQELAAVQDRLHVVTAPCAASTVDPAAEAKELWKQITARGPSLWFEYDYQSIGYITEALRNARGTK